MASFDGNSRLQTPASFRFPKREFGNTLVMKRSFQRKWFDRWSWLHYEENLDLVFCFTCFALDLAISGIEDRFKFQPTWLPDLCKCPQGSRCATILRRISIRSRLLCTDFDSLLLPAHLEIFSNSFPGEGKIVLSDILKFFRICTPGQLGLRSVN